jgi:hypothetical protein
MQDYNYNFEIRTLLTHFAAAFNDVKIKRFDGEKFEKEIIKVPLTYAPKSHILNDIIGLTDTIRLPIIAVEITSQGRDNERVKNKIDDLIYKNSDGNFVNSSAIPWNLSLTMTILAKYQEDMDQIIQNFVVNNDPYAIISWQEPKSGRELRTEILWDGSISLEYPGKQQTAKDPPFRITATTNFTVKGYLFKTSQSNSKPICLINTDYIFTDNFFCDYNQLQAYTTDSEKDFYTLSGKPMVRYVTPNYLTEKSNPTIVIQGFWLQNTVGLFVSGTNPNMYPLTEYKPFSGEDSFFGYKIDEYTLSPDSISFVLPPPKTSGFVDIIAVNGCGIGQLTNDSSDYVSYSAGVPYWIPFSTSAVPVSCF